MPDRPTLDPLDCALVVQLAEHGPQLRRPTLVDALSVAPTTLYDHIVPLVARGIVTRRRRPSPRRRGRPAVEFLLTPEGYKYYQDNKSTILKNARRWGDGDA